MYYIGILSFYAGEYFDLTLVEDALNQKGRFLLNSFSSFGYDYVLMQSVIYILLLSSLFTKYCRRIFRASMETGASR